MPSLNLSQSAYDELKAHFYPKMYGIPGVDGIPGATLSKQGIIKQLVKDGNYDGYCNPEITDENYPQTEDMQIPEYKIIPGSEIGSGWVYRKDVENKFKELGLRLPTATEALYIFTKSPRDKWLCAFLSGSQDAFIVNEDDDQRDLDLNTCDDYWYSHYYFVGVCCE